MKIYEIIAFNREILDRIDRIGIRPGDHKYLALYDDYQTMKARNEKMTYIVAVLAERYSLSERKVYNIIAHFGKDCTERAAFPPPRIIDRQANKPDFCIPKTFIYVCKSLQCLPAPVHGAKTPFRIAIPRSPARIPRRDDFRRPLWRFRPALPCRKTSTTRCTCNL